MPQSTKWLESLALQARRMYGFESRVGYQKVPGYLKLAQVYATKVREWSDFHLKNSSLCVLSVKSDISVRRRV